MAYIDPKALGLEIFRVSGDEVMCRCPFHDDRHPSASFNVSTGLFFCFSCGASSNAKGIARKLGTSVETTAFVSTKRELLDESWRPILNGSYAYDNTYLASRGVTKKLIRRFEITENADGIVIPIKSKSGKAVGALLRRYTQVHNQRYKFFGQSTPLWPMPALWRVNPKRRVFLVEGVFGALRARKYGVQAFATFGVSSMSGLSRLLGGLDVYAVFDNDFSGYVGYSRVLKELPRARCVVPGLEADELEREFWELLSNERLSTTRSLRTLATLSKDKKKYMRIAT